MLSKSIAFLQIIFFILTISSLGSCEQKDTRPNIILIIADDMNWDDSGAYGHPSIKTPHIDKMAKEGMKFTQAFLTTSSCSPSRASIITGKYPHNTDAEQLHWPIPEGHHTFVDQLKSSGYWTGLAGKYHLGSSVRHHFDQIMEVGTAGFQLGNDGKQKKMKGDGSGCESWISLLRNKPDNKPFFAWLAAVDPHRPYGEATIEDPHDVSDVIVPPYFPDTDRVRKDLALYYDEISRMDMYIGKVMDELEEQGLSESTMILFITDNGRPFPRDKTTLYEGGIKTPWIVKWPSKIKAGSINHNLISSIDIAPTFVKLAGLEPLQAYEGLDFTSMLDNEENQLRDEIYAEDHWHDYEDYGRAIRTSQYKYIKNFYTDLPNTPPADAFRGLTYQSMLQEKENGNLTNPQSRCFEIPRPAEELYDIVNDPYELINLAHNSIYSDALKDMRRRMETMRTLTKDSEPTYRTPDEFDRETGKPTAARLRPRPPKSEMIEELKKSN